MSTPSRPASPRRPGHLHEREVRIPPRPRPASAVGERPRRPAPGAGARPRWGTASPDRAGLPGATAVRPGRRAHARTFSSRDAGAASGVPVRASGPSVPVGRPSQRHLSPGCRPVTATGTRAGGQGDGRPRRAQPSTQPSTQPSNRLLGPRSRQADSSELASLPETRAGTTTCRPRDPARSARGHRARSSWRLPAAARRPTSGSRCGCAAPEPRRKGPLEDGAGRRTTRGRWSVVSGTRLGGRRPRTPPGDVALTAPKAHVRAGASAARLGRGPGRGRARACAVRGRAEGWSGGVRRASPSRPRTCVRRRGG